MLHKHIIALAGFLPVVACCILFATASQAQEVPSSTRAVFGDRWAFKTNAFEWLLTIPNFQVEFDLSPSEYNRFTILLGGKYNWDTSTKFAPYFVFNLLDIRPEVRYHFRLGNGKGSASPALLEKLASKKPRPWLAWYAGVYADYGTYSIKPSSKGYQGHQAGIGISGGFEIPLYSYPKGAIDFELGASIGVLATRYDTFQLNEDSYTYSRVGAPDDKYHFLPMLTELRAVFAWRHRSVKDRYTSNDPAVENYKMAVSDIATSFDNSTKAAFDNTLDARTLERYQQNDSLYRAEFINSLKETVDFCIRNVEHYKLDKKRQARLMAQIKRRESELLKDFDQQLLGNKGNSDKNQEKHGRKTKRNKDAKEEPVIEETEEE